jgi:RHS repeat-associated protein
VSLFGESGSRCRSAGRHKDDRGFTRSTKVAPSAKGDHESNVESPPEFEGSCVSAFAYDNNGAETLRTFPGNAKLITVNDASGRPTRITGKDGTGAAKVDIGYSYAAPGGTGTSADRATVQTRTSHLETGITAGAVTTYAYDSLSRLKTATEKTGTTTRASWTYAYDSAGNRTSQIRAGSTGAAAGTTGYGYDNANRLISTTGAPSAWTYDSAGNQTKNGATGQTASFNSRGAVTGIGATTYSAFGQSVVGMFDKTGAYLGGYSYSPYGEQRAISAGTAMTDNSLRYIGGYLDSASGLYKLGARYYDPSIGRFTQFDPSGQESHPYGYANCNPINASDPSGTASVCVITAFAFTAIGAIAAVAAGVAGVLATPVTGGISLAGAVQGIAVVVGIVTAGTGVIFGIGSLLGTC